MGFNATTNIDVSDLKDRVDILDLIGGDTELRMVANTRGGEFAGPCPFCGGRDRMRVQPSQGLWWCRSCSERWQDAIAYIEKRDQCSFLDACRTLARLANASDASIAAHHARRVATTDSERAPSDAWQAAASRFIEQGEVALWSPEGQSARAYLAEQRGLNDRTLRKWRVGFNASDGWDPPEAWGLTGADTNGKKVWRPRSILVPWISGRDIWQVKVRRVEGDPKYVGIIGGHPLLFGSHTLLDRQVALLTEGEFDAMIADQEAGDLVGVATLGSASKGISHGALDFLLTARHILAAYDTDSHGERGASRLANASARVRRVRVPCGKDVTELWQQGWNVRAWIEWELSQLGPCDPGRDVDLKSHIVGDTSPLQQDDGLEIRYGFDVRWGRERGWLMVRDPFEGGWHLVWARDCPRDWVSMAQAEKERRWWSAAA